MLQIYYVQKCQISIYYVLDEIIVFYELKLLETLTVQCVRAHIGCHRQLFFKTEILTLFFIDFHVH